MATVSCSMSRNLAENDIHGEHPLFVNQTIFLWPLVCKTCQVQMIQEEGILSGCFRGSAASTFHDIVEAIGFDENTYPYYALSEEERETVDDDTQVNNHALRVWRGANYTGK